MIPKLRPHQIDLKNRIYDFAINCRSILAVAPTGFGKTIVFSDIANDFYKARKKVWILTHRREIRYQTIDKLVSFGLKPGQIASGEPTTNNSVQCASVQTVVNMLDKINYLGLAPDLIITDEAHHAVADTWLKILAVFPHALHLGFTATPQRGDGIGLGTVFRTMIEGVSTSYLVDKGFLVPPLLLSSDAALEYQKQDFSIKGNDFDTKEQTTFASQNAIVQDTIKCYRKYFNGAPAIIFCASIEDCDTVTKAMINAGYKCQTVKDRMDKDHRRDCIHGLANGKYNALCSYAIISEGVDIPVLAGVILRRLTRTLATYLQMCGRAFRIYEGKKWGLIVDQAGNYYLHGHPLEKHIWSLEGKKINSGDKKEVMNITECPNMECRAVLLGAKVTRCPHCGTYIGKIITAKEQKELKVVDAAFLKIARPVISEDYDFVTGIEISKPPAIQEIIETLSSRKGVYKTQEDRLKYLTTVFENDTYTRSYWEKYRETKYENI